MSKLIYCNFESIQEANAAVEKLKQAFPDKMMSFLVDNSYRYSQSNFNEYAPQGIPTAVLNQLYDGEVPPQVTSATQTTHSASDNEKKLHVTSVKMAFADDTPRDVLNKITVLGGTNIKSFFS